MAHDKNKRTYWKNLIREAYICGILEYAMKFDNVLWFLMPADSIVNWYVNW
jgi:hypothetical protein